MIGKNGFIEWCEVHGNFYGTSKQQITDIMASKRIPLLDIDVQGAIKFEKAFPDSNFMVVVPPSVESLRQRLLGRGTETEKTLETRLGNARGELNQVFSMRSTFCYRVINEDLTLARRTFNLLISGLYQFELTGKKPAEIANGKACCTLF